MSAASTKGLQASTWAPSLEASTSACHSIVRMLSYYRASDVTPPLGSSRCQHPFLRSLQMTVHSNSPDYSLASGHTIGGGRGPALVVGMSGGTEGLRIHS